MPGPHGFAVRSAHLRLMASTGKAPLVCTPLDRSRETRPAIALAPDAAASTAPRPTFVTMANAPLTGRDGRSCRVDSTKSRRGKFSYKGIDQYLGVICPSGCD